MEFYDQIQLWKIINCRSRYDETNVLTKGKKTSKESLWNYFSENVVQIK